MQLTERQTNAALQAIVVKYNPNFYSLPPEARSSLGKATYWWFAPIVRSLPSDTHPEDLATDYWELIKRVAANHIVGAIRHAHPQHAQETDEKLLSCVSLSDLEHQAIIFLQLAKEGLQAALDHSSLQEMADSFGSLDLNLELKKLLAREG